MQTASDITTRVGGWLFRHRSAIPLPFVLAILLVPAGENWRSVGVLGLGVAITLSGEAIRMWGVHHIGVISRTRSDRLGPLIETGPFGLVRNPLYIGNILLWLGFALTARLAWLAPIIFILLGAEYHAIVRWEEQLLESRRGEEYRSYKARVPRWIPNVRTGGHPERTVSGATLSQSAADGATFQPYSLGDTLFSERGTLLAIGAGYLLLWLKVRY